MRLSRVQSAVNIAWRVDIAIRDSGDSSVTLCVSLPQEATHVNVNADFERSPDAANNDHEPAGRNAVPVGNGSSGSRPDRWIPTACAHDGRRIAARLPWPHYGCARSNGP